MGKMSNNGQIEISINERDRKGEIKIQRERQREKQREKLRERERERELYEILN